MKRIVLFCIILFSGTIYGQNNDSIDSFGRLLLLTTKQLENEISNNEQRELIISELEKRKNVTNDSIFFKDAQNYISHLSTLMFYDFKSKDINSLSEEDKKGFVFDYDKFKGVTFIQYKKLKRSVIEPYIRVISEYNNIGIRLKTSYYSSDWIFFKNVIVLIGDKKFNYEVGNVDHNASGSSITEVSDIPVNEHTMKILNEIKNSGNQIVSIRLEGKRVYDFQLKQEEKEGIIKVLNLFETLKVN